ncbi:FUSC family protein [Microbacterium dextranolyticum]|uniref:FUSC family protein n=1 Tax=Microbacterium dextranolyticum TaxID=36806 RepID=A0A9W6HQ91_9MICO|nr:FUSC family protein [Microbacterium dextranolyticum]MBM7464062.1 hypothetical protein [Microbacterium dextranolyticum]GLJ96609.1 FUSC family protein [Microbacterium dextranolyticum]
MHPDHVPLGARMHRELRHVADSLTSFGPPTGRRWPLALQAGLAMAAPIVLLAAVGRSDIALLAASGAFTVIYGGWLRPRERARFAPLIALALIACAAAGTLAAAGGTPVVLAGVVIVTIVSAAVAGRRSLGPPGTVFFVLVFGLSAQITALHDGGRAVDPLTYLVVVAGSCVFACVLVAAPLALPRYRAEKPRPLAELFPARWGGVARSLTARSAIVAVLGVCAAMLVDPTRSYWVVCAGIAVAGMPLGRRAAATRGIHRSVGTIGGGVLYLVLAFLPLPIWALGIVLGALQFVIELVVVRHYALALVFITPLVLLLIGAASGHAATVPLALERVVDTVVGAAIGTAAALTVRLHDD